MNLSFLDNEPSFMRAFLQTVQDDPDSLMLVDDQSNNYWTRDRVNDMSARVYNYLRKRHIGREDFVLILLPRGVLPIIAMIGVWKAGAALTVLEDNYVPERGAESIEKVIARGKSFLEERIYPHEGEDLTILVAAHGAMIRGLQAAGRGADKTNFWGGPWGGSGKPLKNCGAALVTVENGMMKIVEPSLIFYSEET